MLHSAARRHTFCLAARCLRPVGNDDFRFEAILTPLGQVRSDRQVPGPAGSPQSGHWGAGSQPGGRSPETEVSNL